MTPVPIQPTLMRSSAPNTGIAAGATAFGSVASGAAFFLAPPTLLSSVGVGIIWAIGKWGFRKIGAKELAVAEVQRSEETVKRDGS